MIAADLNSHDLGNPLAVEVGGRLVVGTLREVQHRSDYAEPTRPGRVFLSLSVGSLRWSGHVEPDAEVDPDRHTTAVPVSS